MSAHVVPKAKSFSEEEEKTTLESQWEEDEASTTIAQGEVQDKLRTLGIDSPKPNTGSTNTGEDLLDESTVDDQHANPALAALTPPIAMPVRLVIMQGNDLGQEIEVIPGKTYTIGRGIDNDVVLTDIAVSRKHFDLRHEDGSWVVIDRGSGNGTVVNGNIEDNPFMLANGDVIEIGNTVFRFDHPNADIPSRATGFEADADADEMSTVAGKPLHQKLIEPPSETPRGASNRPKTLPPPTPLRPRPPSLAPAYPLQAAPASTLPMPQQLSSRAPVLGPSSPTMLGESMSPSLPNVMPSTIPGQVPSMSPTMIPSSPGSPMHPMYAGYPQATEIPPHSVHAQMLSVQTQNRRGDGSTAHVPAVPYGARPVPLPAPRFVPPQLTKRAKYALGAIGLTLFAAISTIAIIKAHGKPTPPTPTAGSGLTPAEPPKVEPTFVTPKIEPPKIVPPKVEPSKIETPKIEPSRVEPPKIVKSDLPKTEPPPPVPKPEPKLVKVEPPKVEPPKPEPSKPESKPPPQKREAKKAAPPPSPPPPAPRRVATADDSRDRADALYRDKKFSEAARLLDSASKASPDSADAKELHNKSQHYAQLARAYNTGMAPGTKAADAFEALRSASNFDQLVGNAFEGDLSAKLALVAPKAAISFVAQKSLEKAHTAVLAAEKLGAGGDANIKAVKAKLESEAGQIYAEAIKELDSSPDTAKEKFRQIKAIVDSKSQWYQKATKQLAGA